MWLFAQGEGTTCTSGWRYYMYIKINGCTKYTYTYMYLCPVLTVVPSQFLSISIFASFTIGGIHTFINLHMLTLDVQYTLLSPLTCTCAWCEMSRDLPTSTVHINNTTQTLLAVGSSLYTPHTWFYDIFNNYDFTYSTSQIPSPDSAHKQIHPPFQLEVE